MAVKRPTFIVSAIIPLIQWENPSNSAQNSPVQSFRAISKTNLYNSKGTGKCWRHWVKIWKYLHPPFRESYITIAWNARNARLNFAGDHQHFWRNVLWSMRQKLNSICLSIIISAIHGGKRLRLLNLRKPSQLWIMGWQHHIAGVYCWKRYWIGALKKIDGIISSHSLNVFKCWFYIH